MMSNELTTRGRDPIALGKVLAASGYFTDAKSAAQAAVKVMAGEEVGLGPIASMTGIHLVQGKVTLGANLIAALVRRHPDYDYRVAEHTAEVCTIEFVYRGTIAGTSTFTLKDAEQAGLAKSPTWKAHPRNMLFARAISNGAKWYAPDVSAGAPIYTPDELGAEVDGETMEYVPAPVPAVVQDAPHQIAAGVELPTAPGSARSAGNTTDDVDAFDPHGEVVILKRTFGDDAVRAAFAAAGVATFSDFTEGVAETMRATLSAHADGDGPA